MLTIRDQRQGRTGGGEDETADYYCRCPSGDDEAVEVLQIRGQRPRISRVSFINGRAPNQLL